MTCQPTSTGAFSIHVTARDINNYVADSDATTIAIAADPSLSVSAQPTLQSSGNPLYVNATVLGGTAPFVFSYSGLPTGCQSSNTPTLACKPTGSGSIRVTVHVVDGAGFNASANLTLTIAGAANSNAGAVGWLNPVVVLVVLALVAGVVIWMIRKRRGAIARAGKESATDEADGQTPPEPRG